MCSPQIIFRGHMRPAVSWSSLMRPSSQFDFETPDLNKMQMRISSSLQFLLLHNFLLSNLICLNYNLIKRQNLNINFFCHFLKLALTVFLCVKMLKFVWVLKEKCQSCSLYIILNQLKVHNIFGQLWKIGKRQQPTV